MPFSLMNYLRCEENAMNFLTSGPNRIFAGKSSAIRSLSSSPVSVGSRLHIDDIAP